MSGRGRGRGKGGQPLPQHGAYYRRLRDPQQLDTRPPRPPNVAGAPIPDSFGPDSAGYVAFMDSLGTDKERQHSQRRSAAAAASGSKTPAQDRLMGGAASSGAGSSESGEAQAEKERRYRDQQQRLARLAMVQGGEDYGARKRSKAPSSAPTAGGVEEMEQDAEAATATATGKKRGRRPAKWDNGTDRMSANLAREMGATEETVQLLMSDKQKEQEEARKKVLNPVTDPAIAADIIRHFEAGNLAEAGKAVVKGLDNANANTAKVGCLLDAELQRLKRDFERRLTDQQRLYAKQCLLFVSKHLEQQRGGKEPRWDDNRLLGAVAGLVYQKYGLTILWKHVATIHTIEGPFSGKILIRFSSMAGDSPYPALLQPSLSPAGREGIEWPSSSQSSHTRSLWTGRSPPC